MRLPRLANPIKSDASPFLTTTRISARNISVPERIVSNKLLLAETDTAIAAPMNATPVGPAARSGGGGGGVGPSRTGRASHDMDGIRAGAHVTSDDSELTTADTPLLPTGHTTSSRRTTGINAAVRVAENSTTAEMKPSAFSVAPFASAGNEQPQSDPLDLVIAKRKKKELADPVIAEAIMTACKLPPPPIPETQNMDEVPEEIQQLISFGFSRQTTDEAELDFLRNYPLHQKPQETPKVFPTTHVSRYEAFRRKYWATTFGKHGSGYGDRDNDSEIGVDQDQLIAGGRKEFFPITVHSDEDWFMESVLHVMCILLIVLTLPLSLIFCLKVVAHYERAVLFRLGRLVSATAQGPGLIIVLPCLDRYRILDLRTFTFDVPTQEVLTKDSVTVVVNAVVYYRVRDPVRAVVNVEDANRATRVLGQTTLRNVLGTVNLDQLLTAREDIAALMQECLDSVTEAWGVKVERVEIKDVRLPIQLQRAMAAEAESVREATAKVIAAEGEMRAAGALKAAAFEIQQHPIAMQLRFLQAVNSISSGKESTIIFPVPLDVFSIFRASMDNPILKDRLMMDEITQERMLDMRTSLESLQTAPVMLSGATAQEKELMHFESIEDPMDASSQIV